MRTFLHLLLILAIGSVHAFGTYATVQITHSHEVNTGHGHQHHGHQHHGHDHTPSQEPSDSNGDQSNSSEREHTHTESLGADAPLIIPDPSHTNSLLLTRPNKFWGWRDSPPDQPFYCVIKPPQLG